MHSLKNFPLQVSGQSFLIYPLKKPCISHDLQFMYPLRQGRIQNLSQGDARFFMSKKMWKQEQKGGSPQTKFFNLKYSKKG